KGLNVSGPSVARIHESSMPASSERSVGGVRSSTWMARLRSNSMTGMYRRLPLSLASPDLRVPKVAHLHPVRRRSFDEPMVVLHGLGSVIAPQSDATTDDISLEVRGEIHVR